MGDNTGLRPTSRRPTPITTRDYTAGPGSARRRARLGCGADFAASVALGSDDATIRSDQALGALAVNLLSVTAPGTLAGGSLYVEAGALKYKGTTRHRHHPRGRVMNNDTAIMLAPGRPAAGDRRALRARVAELRTTACSARR